ncbi:MAG: extracellular solute-binding protein [Anaerolineales bacterium]|nr:MAG: extracellular solute-binding protein [Anaerolineales bacterium]
MKPVYRTLTFLILIGLSIGACDILVPAQTVTPPAAPTATALPEILPTESTSVQSAPILIWLAPQFGPDTPAGQLLTNHLAEFQAQHPGTRINLRVKPQGGPGGLLRALEAASVAAPAVVPDLLTLSSDDLELAAQSALLLSLPESLVDPENPGWYDYALPQVRFEGVSYGLPFASELEILAYRTDLYDAPPRSWDALLSEPRTFLFPASDPRARFALAMYLGSGGELTDDNGQPELNITAVNQVLTWLVSARSSSVIPLAVRQYTSPLETWTELKTNHTASAMVPIADFLREHNPERFAALALPTESGQGIGLASTWSWAMTASDVPRQELILTLISWLAEPGFQGAFSHALGLLPTSQEALAAWPEGDASALVSSLVTITRPEPDLALRNVIAPALQAAIEAVLSAGQDPATAAQEAASLVHTP